MKILKHRSPEKERYSEYVGTRHNCACGCRFEIEKEDLEKIRELPKSPGPWYTGIGHVRHYIHCPECNRTVPVMR